MLRVLRRAARHRVLWLSRAFRRDVDLVGTAATGRSDNLQEPIAVEDLTAVVLTHEHPDHCVDLYGLHVLLKWGLERHGFPVYAPAGLEQHLGSLVGGD